MRFFAIYFAFLSVLALLFTLSSVSESREAVGALFFAITFAVAAVSSWRCIEVEDSGVEHDSRPR